MAWIQCCLWLWCRPAATAAVQPLDGEVPYAAAMALKRQKKKKLFLKRKFIVINTYIKEKSIKHSNLQLQEEKQTENNKNKLSPKLAKGRK